MFRTVHPFSRVHIRRRLQGYRLLVWVSCPEVSETLWSLKRQEEAFELIYKSTYDFKFGFKLDQQSEIY
jgi:hypothetical protein